MANLDVLKILSLGVVGLGFLLAVLAYRLLVKEQEHSRLAGPSEVSQAAHRPFIRAIYAFMAFSLLLCILGLIAQVLDQDAASSRRKFDRELLSQGPKLPTELTRTGGEDILKGNPSVENRNRMISLSRIRIDEDYRTFVNEFATKYDSPLTHMLITAMDATRELVQLEMAVGMRRSIEQYGYSQAIGDLREYFQAGTVLGSIDGIYSDSRVKRTQAKEFLRHEHAVSDAQSATPEMFARRAGLAAAIDRLDGVHAKSLASGVKDAFPEINAFIDAQYPPPTRESDMDGSKARVVLKRALVLTVRSQDDANTWQRLIAGR